MLHYSSSGCGRPWIQPVKRGVSCDEAQRQLPPGAIPDAQSIESRADDRRRRAGPRPFESPQPEGLPFASLPHLPEESYEHARCRLDVLAGCGRCQPVARPGPIPRAFPQALRCDLPRARHPAPRPLLPGLVRGPRPGRGLRHDGQGRLPGRLPPLVDPDARVPGRHDAPRRLLHELRPQAGRA